MDVGRITGQGCLNELSKDRRLRVASNLSAWVLGCVAGGASRSRSRPADRRRRGAGAGAGETHWEEKHSRNLEDEVTGYLLACPWLAARPEICKRWSELEYPGRIGRWWDVGQASRVAKLVECGKEASSQGRDGETKGETGCLRRTRREQRLTRDQRRTTDNERR
ncbi:hypothetical protein F4777DRAFT_117174 [Nemania sp. FL0916]|nr:hypothetical protein F4777DRAFT_117174 [Nemania sp. FL0916]